MRIGVYQSNDSGLTPSQRLDKLESKLKHVKLDMVVCAELFTSGYNAGEKLIEYAEPKIGRISNMAVEIAKAMNCAIVYGYPEKHRDQIYNAAVCINSHGEFVANHRKLMLPPGFESDYFCAGNVTTFFQLDGLTFAILICYDVEYPEAVRHAAQGGAHVVIVPTALAENWGVVAEKLIPTRAFENGIWLVYANHTGIENGLKYYGGSCIVAPDGREMARAITDECIISTQLDIQSVHNAQLRLPYLKGRLFRILCHE